MNKDFFIIMNHPSDGNIPIVDKEGNMLFFETEEEARHVAENHYWASKTGYEIFELGCGI